MLVVVIRKITASLRAGTGRLLRAETAEKVGK
jgi:hypothetical protein